MARELLCSSTASLFPLVVRSMTFKRCCTQGASVRRIPAQRSALSPAAGAGACEAALRHEALRQRSRRLVSTTTSTATLLDCVFTPMALLFSGHLGEAARDPRAALDQAEPLQPRAVHAPRLRAGGARADALAGRDAWAVQHQLLERVLGALGHREPGAGVRRAGLRRGMKSTSLTQPCVLSPTTKTAPPIGCSRMHRRSAETAASASIADPRPHLQGRRDT